MGLKELKIIDLVSQKRKEISRSVIQAETGIPSATLTRILPKLVDGGYLEKSGYGKYSIGDRFSRLAMEPENKNFPSLRSNNCIFLSLSNNWAVAEVNKGINTVLQNYQLNSLIHSVFHDLDELKDPDISILKQAAGIIIMSPQPIPEKILQKIKIHVPYIIHVGYSGHDIIDTISWDQEGAFNLMTEHMIASGYDKIIYLGNSAPHKKSHEFQARLKGYEYTVRNHGLTPRVENTSMGFFRDKPWDDFIGDILKRHKISDRVGFVLSVGGPDLLDLTTARLTDLAESKGIDIGFCSVIPNNKNNYSFRHITDFTVTIIEPWERVGEVAAYRLVSRFQGEAAPPQKTMVQAELTAGN